MLCCSSSQIGAKQIETRWQSVEASAGLVDDVCAEVAEADGHIAGYIIGKVEGAGPKQLGISEANLYENRHDVYIYTLLFFRSIVLYVASSYNLCMHA